MLQVIFLFLASENTNTVSSHRDKSTKGESGERWKGVLRGLRHTLLPSFLPAVSACVELPSSQKRMGKMRGGWASRMALLCCVSLSFLSAFALLKETGIGSARRKSFVQGPWPAREVGTAAAAAAEEVERRGMMGPGSYPPRCASKCGKCTPCRPVHVPVPPGTPVTSEYYPEAWRCKCGNRLYVP